MVFTQRMVDESEKNAQTPVETPTEEKPGVFTIPDGAEKTVIRGPEEQEEGTPQKRQYLPPYLVVVDGPRTGARFPLKEGVNIIGRAPGNEVRLEDQSVSRQHAEVLKNEYGWVVRDLGSKNGTLVNGKEVAEPVVIGHKDIVKTGIYLLRLITQVTPLEQELTLPPELATQDRTVFVAAPPDSLTARMEKTEPSIAPVEAVEEGTEESEPGTAMSLLAKLRGMEKRKLALFGALAIVLVGTVAYLGKRIFLKPHAPQMRTLEKMAPELPPEAEGMPPAAAPEAAPPTAAVPPPEAAVPPPAVPPAGQPPAGQPPAAPGVQPAAPPPAAPVQAVPIFLDFASSPMPAKVTFQGQELGQTPLRVNIQIEPGRPYQAQALFSMPEIGQQYSQQLEFKADVGASVVPVFFRGPIGMLKVMNLPRDVEFYLEGKFSYDKFNEQSAKLREVVLQKPMYIPFGQYVLELRRARQLGETSPTFVSDIIYRRDFTVAEDSPTYTVAVSEEDLRTFPVKVRSDPQNAEVYIDGKSVGKTPYEGIFPLGEHRLTIRKEGYFEHAEDLKVDIDTPFVANVTLKTSVAGAHLNNAKLAMGRAMYQEAINELAQALESSPAPSEVALANLLLGQAYFKLGDVPRAQSYFEQAKASDEQRYPAMLGLVNCYAVGQQLDKALPLIVEVMLKNKDEAVKREANDLFQKISPFRSVIYVYTDPPGAQVVVNDKPVEQPTPLILHEMPLGNYRLRIQKPGYLPTDLSLTLSVNEFNPVIVTLKPIPQ
jgi:tetratricopeptide (TPR) repeat protein